MKKSRFNEEQIIGILKQQEAGTEGSRFGPGTWGKRSDDLHLEEQVRWHGRQRGATIESAR